MDDEADGASAPDELDESPGRQPVSVWAYSNADTVELFLNGKSLGVRTFDHKSTTDGRSYLETTEPTGDDKTFPGGSYTSPNGSTGKLHLSWDVPFEAGTLKAVATRDGKVVATDSLSTAGQAGTTTLTPDRAAIPADGRSLSYITVDVVDKAGTMVPDADDALHFSVTGGGTLVGLDTADRSARRTTSPPIGRRSTARHSPSCSPTAPRSRSR